MKIISYTTGPIQVNTYLVYDEKTKKDLSWIRVDIVSLLRTK